jgi:hypothetical protein
VSQSEPILVAVRTPWSKRPWPVLGPALTVFGVLLWSFVVMGELTTSWRVGAPLEESTAAVIVVLATMAAWFVAMRESARMSPPQGTGRLAGRSAAVALVAVMLWGLSIFFAIGLGSIGTSGHDVLVAFLLWLAAAVAVLTGPRRTAPGRRSRSTPAARALVALLWVGAALLTMGAFVEMVAE